MTMGKPVPTTYAKVLLGILSVFIVTSVSHLGMAAPEKAGENPWMSQPFSVVVTLTILSLIPFLLMTTTAFVKISTTLHIARSALGVQDVPSNTVVMALAASLTLLAMAPVTTQIVNNLQPILEAKQAQDSLQVVKQMVGAAKDPMRKFLKANGSEHQRARFFQVAKRAQPTGTHQPQPDDFSILLPAFLTTELYEAFALGFAIYLPFLVIDLVVANVLVALGMQAMQPNQVSLPFKLLLFVSVDGWGLLAQALVTSYQTG
jgi:type III secretion protein R